MEATEFPSVAPVLDPAVRKACRLPYPGHPRGCPNWGKRADCPPRAALLPDVLDLSNPVYVAYTSFDLGAHVERMRARHPDWSDRKLRCCLYWQGTARKALWKKIEAFLETRPGLLALTCPEACGVDVTASMALIGVKLDWPPMKLTYQVALIGTPVNAAR